MIKTAINGFGRIGRIAFRVWLKRLDLRKKLDIVAVNTSGSMPISGWIHLLKYDTAYGKLNEQIKAEEIKDPEKVTDKDPLIGFIQIQGKKIAVLAQRNPEKLPWGKYQIDLVIESTGVFRDQQGAGKHLKAGAKKVLISAPSKGGNIGTYVLGVNEYKEGKITDNASCTTNCVAPVVAILHSKFGVKKATMTTVHGYTDDQRLQDNSHKDLRRARAAALNVIPTTTGAAISTIKTIPQLKGLFNGIAVRVPVNVGSISDIVCLTKKKVTVEEVNKAFEEASQSPRWKGIIAATKEPLVSSDIIGRSESAIVDLSFTQVIDGDLVKVLAWYDNEWGYANRLLEQAIHVGEIQQNLS
jgi:glyceraldehyde-3-phosphate dehydrogenase (NAD(P))